MADSGRETLVLLISVPGDQQANVWSRSSTDEGRYARVDAAEVALEMPHSIVYLGQIGFRLTNWPNSS